MPYQPIFSELELEELIHGSRIVAKSADLGRIGVSGSLIADLFPSTMAIPGTITFTGSVSPWKQLSSDPGPSAGFSTYPSGLSYLGTGSGSSWPHEFGSVLTFKFASGSGQRSLQLHWHKTGSGTIRWRTRNNDDTAWMSWAEIADSINGIVAPDGSAGTPGIRFASDTDTGIRRTNPDEMAIVTGGLDRIWIDTTRITVWSLQLQMPSGTSAEPSYSFAGDFDTGIRRSAADQIAIVVGGADKLQIGSGSISVYADRILNQDGTTSAPAYSFINDIDTGIYRSASDQIAITTGGSNKVLIGAGATIVYSDQIRAVSGSAGVPAYSFDGDTNTGIRRSAADQIAIVAGGADRLLVGTTGMLYNGNTVWHAGNDGAGSGLDADLIDGRSVASGTIWTSGNDGSGSGLDADLLDGKHATAFALDGGDTSFAANARYDSSIRVVYRSVSTLKIKQDITPLGNRELAVEIPEERRRRQLKPPTGSVLDLTPVLFRSSGKADDKRLKQLGFLYEDVKAKFPVAADPKAESINDRALIAALLLEVQKLRDEVNDLKQKLVNS